MNKIKELREKRGIPQKALAIDLGVTQPTICDWESGRKVPSAKSTAKLADYFGVSTDYILGREDAADSEYPLGRPSPGAIRLPVYGRVPAGVPLEAIDDVIDWEEIPQEWSIGGKTFFATKVKGDSMYPKYIEGDIIIVQVQPDCESGQDCVVYVNGYDATLKRVYKLDDGGIRLVPANPSYAPKTYYPGDDPISIAGIVVEIRRKP